MTSDVLAGEIRFFAGNFAPSYWLICDGSAVPLAVYPALYNTIGTAFGGDPTKGYFNLPDLRGRVPAGAGTAPGLSPYALAQKGGLLNAKLTSQNLPSWHKHAFSGTLMTGKSVETYNPANSYLGTPGSTDIYSENIGHGTMHNDMVAGRTTVVGQPAPDAFSVMQPYLPLTAVISTTTESGESGDRIGYVSEVRLFAGTTPPENWLPCDGRLLDISRYIALYSIIGLRYGGDGQTTFGLPDLRGRAVVGVGAANGLVPVQLGQQGGVEQQVMTEATTPTHQHQATPKTTIVLGDDANSNSPDGKYFGFTADWWNDWAYSKTAGIATGVNSVQGLTDYVGADLPVTVVQPYLGVNYIICIEGIFPPQP